MRELHPSIRSRFRAPNGRIVLQASINGQQATHALFFKEAEAERWTFLAAFGTRAAAEQKLELQMRADPLLDCLIIECEPY